MGRGESLTLSTSGSTGKSAYSLISILAAFYTLKLDCKQISGYWWMPVSSSQKMSGLNRYQNWWLILLKVLVIYDSQDKIYYKMLYIDAIYKKG